MEYRRHSTSGLDPFRYAAARRLDDIAHGAGVWLSQSRAAPPLPSNFVFPRAGSKLHVGQPEPVVGSPAGRAFLSEDVVEVPQAHGGVRMHLPLLDGSVQVGVMTLTLDSVGDDDRRLLRRLAGLVADMLDTKNAYSDLFFQVGGDPVEPVAAADDGSAASRGGLHPGARLPRRR